MNYIFLKPKSSVIRRFIFSGMHESILSIPLKATKDANSNSTDEEEKTNKSPCLHDVLVENLPNVCAENRSIWRNFILSNFGSLSVFDSREVSSHMAAIRLNYWMGLVFD